MAACEISLWFETSFGEEKKKQRAERFGNVSDDDMKKRRAERFAIATWMVAFFLGLLNS